MQRIDVTMKGTTTGGRRRHGLRIALAAAVVLATAGLASADHYPNVPGRVQKKDRAIIDGIARLTYAEPYEYGLSPEECNCIEPTCDGGFMVSCGGEVEPQWAGWLSAVRRTSRETCYVCACAFDFATLRATPVCLGF
jgi:hypothetical protein